MANDATGKIKFLEIISELKHLPRTGWVLCNIDKPETISGHMYRMSVMAMTMKPVDGVDMNHVIRMCLVHDMGESKIGDITPYCGISNEEKDRMETQAFKELESLLPDDGRQNFEALFTEYNSRETPEAKLVKELDTLDLIIQAWQYERHELQTKGVVHHHMQDFFRPTLLSKVVSDELKSWLDEVLKQRTEFMSTFQPPDQGQKRKIEELNGSAKPSETVSETNVSS